MARRKTKNNTEGEIPALEVSDEAFCALAQYLSGLSEAKKNGGEEIRIINQKTKGRLWLTVSSCEVQKR